MGGSEDVLTGDGLLRMIFEESIIGITVIGPDRRVLVANAAIRRMFGYTEAELATMRVTDVIHPGEVDEVIARFQELMTGARDSYQVERRYRRRDGSEFWGRLLVSIHRGERPLIIGMLEDITARRETVHALGERVKELTCLHRTARLMLDQQLTSADRLQRVVELLPPAMQHVDRAAASIRHGETTYVTPAYEDARRRVSASFETADGKQGEVTVAYREESSDAGGDPFLAEERALLGSVADMMRASLDHEIAMRAMREANERLNLALTTAGMGFWEWDLRTNRVRWSTQLARMAGVEGELVGEFLQFSHHVHPDDRPILEEWLERAAREESTRGTELRLGPGDGGWRHMLVNTGRFRDDDGRPARVIASVLDVTERRALEESLRQAQKLEALGRVAGGVAHDFNNLLSVMLGGADVLRMEMAPDHKWRELVDDMCTAAENGAALTRQLLAFSRKATYQAAAVDVNALVRRSESLLARLAGKRVKVTLALADDAGRVWADPGQLEQVVMNLIVNARDALGDGGGAITVGTAVAAADLVARARLEPGRYTRITVSDSGPGIPPEVLPRLFEPFFTTKELGKGTGLGLAVVASVARQWSGAVVVDSAPGQGATFHVLLPQLAA